jgi:hypothetical protein
MSLFPDAWRASLDALKYEWREYVWRCRQIRPNPADVDLSRPHLLLPIFIANADEHDTDSVEQSFIYKLLYSELKTEVSFKSYVSWETQFADGFASRRQSTARALRCAQSAAAGA